MKLVPMRFKGVEWHHNPREISFSCEEKVNELSAPYGLSYIQDTGRKNMAVKGEGELLGEDCGEQFKRLLSLFKQGGAGVLAVPKLCTVYAVFESLKVLGYPKPGVLKYSFVFREVMEKTVPVKQSEYTGKAGENLWDVSYITGVDIDSLVLLNTWVKRPDESVENRSVRLC
jgi:prophage DNA circulation protein